MDLIKIKRFRTEQRERMRFRHKHSISDGRDFLVWLDFVFGQIHICPFFALLTSQRVNSESLVNKTIEDYFLLM